MLKIGVVGHGFVGQAVSNGFMKYADEVRVHDIDPERNQDSLEEVLNCDFVFVCLPTPYDKERRSMRCDLSAVDGFFSSVAGSDTLFILKSTVPVGTTIRLSKQYNLKNIVHSPEFLTAANHLQDFLVPHRNVIGCIGDPLESGPGQKVKELYEDRFPGCSVYMMDSNESEMVKYVANCFLAVKVAFFNEMHLACKFFGADYETVLNAVVQDPRIGESHTAVPGPDGKFGFGGTCFPKDINSLMRQMEDACISPYVLTGAWKRNVEIRDEKWY